MDLVVLLAALSVVLVLIIFLVIFRKRSNTSIEPGAAGEGERVRPVQRQAPRRAVAARNVRNRRVAAARQDDSDVEEDNETNRQQDDVDVAEAADELFGDAKIGAKKRAKLEAKAEKKAQREAEQRDREDRKKREALLEAEREREAAAKQAEEDRIKESERKAQEEKERKEQEEYMALKASFQVESEGFEQEEVEGEENSLKAFVQHIKDSKVVVLEDLAAKFKLKTQNVIDRITQLQEDGFLTGVIDDRGKFIFVSREELDGVAKFIRQRGRVSISDLAAASNSLINLTPVQPVGQ